MSSRKQSALTDYLERVQADGTPFRAKEFYKETMKWLKKRGVEDDVEPGLVEQYAIARARRIQCEEEISAKGISAALVNASQSYLKQEQVAYDSIRACIARRVILPDVSRNDYCPITIKPKRTDTHGGKK